MPATSTPALDLLYTRARRELDAAFELHRMLMTKESLAALRHVQWYLRHLHAMIYAFSRGHDDHCPKSPGMALRSPATDGAGHYREGDAATTPDSETLPASSRSC